MTAAIVPTNVAAIDGAMIAVGLLDPAAARTPIIVAGIELHARRGHRHERDHAHWWPCPCRD